MSSLTYLVIFDAEKPSFNVSTELGDRWMELFESSPDREVLLERRNRFLSAHYDPRAALEMFVAVEESRRTA